MKVHSIKNGVFCCVTALAYYAVSRSGYSEFGMTGSQPNFRHYLSICLEGLRKITKTAVRIVFVQQRFEPGTFKMCHKALLLDPQCTKKDQFA
jgi:hypothetical protein